MNNYVITIARGFGTGGKMIAEQLAEELGIKCYENRILTLASQLSDVEESRFVEVDEKLKGGYAMSLIKKLPRLMNPNPVEKGFVSDDKLFEYQATIIHQLAQTESCIIVGKCADYVLRDYKNVVSIYIEAPRQYCVERIMTRMQVSESQAHAFISKTDKYRADYYKYYTDGHEWTDPINYDMTLNSYRVGHDNCIEVIKNYLNVKLGL